MLTMSEVLTQLPPANSGEALPAGAASSVSASPADNVTLNNQTPAAPSEKPATGTGCGVDLDKVNDTESLAAAIEAMNLPPLPDENAPPEAPAPAAPAPAPAAAPAPAEEALTRPGELPRNVRMPVRDELDFRIATAVKDARLNGRELSYTDAETQSRAALGMAPAASPAPSAPAPEAAPAAAPAPAPSSGTQEQSADLTAAYAQYQQAREAFDAEAEAGALQEINRLNRMETMREIAQMQQQSVTVAQQQEQFNQRWEQTLATAAAAYPDAANPESALSQRAAEIQQSYAASQDPAMQAIYNSPTSALLYYQLAAADLQVAPQATPAAPAPVLKSTPQPVPGRQPPMAALLAGGQSGNPAPAAPSFDPGRIQTSHDLDSLVESMEGKWAA